MAKSAAGKWVSKVGASGGGKAYKKTRPGNYYGVLAIIVILGLSATLYSRYEYQNPTTTTTSAAGAPAVGTTIYDTFSVQACGQTQANLLPDPTSKAGGIKVLANNVLKVTPLSAADSGASANLKTFAIEYPGLILTNSEISIPGPGGVVQGSKQFVTGHTTCPTGSKYAGQQASVKYYVWAFGSNTPTTYTEPSQVHFAEYDSIVAAFEPAGVTPTKPSTAAMIQAAAATATTTTAPVTSTSIVSSTVITPTTKPVTTTTKAVTTTTKPVTTTTAAG